MTGSVLAAALPRRGRGAVDKLADERRRWWTAEELLNHPNSSDVMFNIQLRVVLNMEDQ